MKKIGILVNFNKDFGFAGDIYKQSSIYLKQVFKEFGLELVRVTDAFFDNEKRVFTKYVDEINGEFQIIDGEYKPDILWKRINNGNEYYYDNFHDFKIFPTSRIITIASDKFETYMFLKDFQPKTALMEHFFKEPQLQNDFPDKILIKPIRSSSGKGIEFFTKQQLLDQKARFDGLYQLFIVQEFKDFSQGYDGITDGIHDLRMVFVGGEFIYSIIREPAKGNFKSNIGSGGSQFSLDYDKIPKEVFQITDEIKSKLLVSSNDICSFDFAYCKDENKWYLLEINFSPGIWFPETDKNWQQIYYESLAKFFLKNL